MRKTIIVFAVLIFAMSFTFVVENDKSVTKWSREHFALRDSLLKVTPDSVAIEIDPSKVPIDIFLQDSIDLFWAFCFGRDIFQNVNMHKFDESSCETCHPIANSGYAKTKDGISIGSGGVNKMINGEMMRVVDSVIVKITGHVDNPKFTSPTFLNCYQTMTALHHAGMGSFGMNAEVPDSLLEKISEWNLAGINGISVQAIQGQVAHNQVVDFIKNDNYFRSLALKAYGREFINDIVVAQSIVVFESLMRTMNSPFQRTLRGEIGLMSKRELEGGILFFNGKYECNSCHGGILGGRNKLSPAFTDYTDGRFAVTGDEADKGLISTPGVLANLDDKVRFGIFHKYKTINGVIKAHPGIANEVSKKERNSDFRKLSLFLRKSNYDESVKYMYFR